MNINIPSNVLVEIPVKDEFQVIVSAKADIIVKFLKANGTGEEVTKKTETAKRVQFKVKESLKPLKSILVRQTSMYNGTVYF